LLIAFSLFIAFQGVVRVNFGPTFIVKYDIQDKVNPISELQPMNPEERMVSIFFFVSLSLSFLIIGLFF
jgi:hypothetical protein